jgi:small subunit ribosomal protein S16
LTVFPFSEKATKEMAVKIRLQRGGAKHAPHYRVVVADGRARRDGRCVERIGTYDPRNKIEEEQVSLQMDRVDYWLGVGAQPSDTVRALIKRERRKQPAVAASESAEAAAGTGES